MSRIVIWPVYIDCGTERRLGRRLSRELCVKKPTVAEIVVAAEKLGLKPEVVKKSYPRLWWVYRDAVVVDKMGSKRETLKAIARKIQELRRQHA
ncbi:MAG: signal recognition particle subunit SRP19/SEC65 family protein [Acidilobaceae archaeon]